MEMTFIIAMIALFIVLFVSLFSLKIRDRIRSKRLSSLKDKLDHYSRYNYYELRAEAEKYISRPHTHYVCRMIGYYSNNKNFRADFNDIFVIDNDIYIYTIRPGLWIGLHGQTIDDILEYLNTDGDGNKKYDYHIHFI